MWNAGRFARSQAVITVHDTGAGIPREDLPRIWDRLYRGDRSRAERGLGLGLSLVRAYVRALGGSVDVESEPGRGSVFAVPAKPTTYVMFGAEANLSPM